MNIGTRIKNTFAGMWEDTQAVSPIVAVLVLVVVAITGAAAVGSIVGTFSSDVKDESNTEGLTAASSTEILVAGSSTVYPVSVLLAEAYMDEHQGVKITVQGGGSGAGISSTGLGIVDIGAASKPVIPDDYPSEYDLKVHQIGGSAVVVIGNGLASGNVSKADLQMLYNDTDGDTLGINISDVTTVVQRTDASGTEETFAKYLFGNKNVDDAAEDTGVDQKNAIGNDGVLEMVEDTPKSIGFVDYGFAARSDKVDILGIYDPDAGKLYFDIEKGDIKKELKKDNGEHYVNGLTRPLNYITKGNPNTMVQAYITFAQSPGAIGYFDDCGYFAITEFA